MEAGLFSGCGTFSLPRLVGGGKALELMFTGEAVPAERAVEEVAKRLGNTRSVCRKSYIHPAVLEAYLDGSLLDTLEQRATSEMENLGSMRPEEAAVLAFLQEWIKREAAGRKKKS
jgi:DNA topoisomerase-1